jgi:hypothetical protein
MPLEYSRVETLDPNELKENDSIKITGILGSFKRQVYEIDVFKLTTTHVYGIALVLDNIPEGEMLGDRPKPDPDSLREVYVRLVRDEPLHSGQVRIDTLPASAVAEGQPIEDIDDTMWTVPHLGVAVLELAKFPTQ